MSRALSNTTAYVEVDGREYALEADRDLVDVMTLIEAAARTEPSFVDLSNGDRTVNVLISTTTRVVITVRSNDPLPLLPDVTHQRSFEDPYFEWE